MSKFILLANGRTPKKGDITYLKRSGYQTIFCADGGANAAFRLGIAPDYIIGDFDSVRPDVLLSFQNTSGIIKFNRQDDTDVEKCLKYAIENGFDDCCMLGVTGDRLDHSYCNLGIALKYSDRLKLRIISESTMLQVISGSVCFASLPGEVISIFGFDEKTRFSTKGLKYPLKDEALPFGKRESTSNVALGNEFSIDVKGGRAFLMRSFSAVRKGGFL